ncbi:MAG: DNA polymerase IV [Candidatus Levybacteria bacterium]|nr:DNA polymerase IV [Candidatus Levybacteria bacterium]
MQRIILHIDFDSFFASVEQQDNLLLRNRPIGVTATNGRTCIIAASREAKRLGIKSPSRTSEAKQICSSIIFVPAHFVHYWEISRKFVALCANFSPTVEVFSLDEVFMDVTYTAPLFGGVYPLITEFKKRLREEVGECITASVGVASNKILAKLASGMRKPDGVMTITKENLWNVYKEMKLTAICGIGGRIESRLQQMGIYTLHHLQKAPLSALIAEFGNVEGHFLWNVGQGEDDRQVIPHELKPDVKSVGRQYCLPQNEYDSRKVLQNLYELCEEVTLKLRRLDKKARSIGFYLGGEKVYSGKYTFDHYINTGSDLFNGCLYLLNRHCEETTIVADEAIPIRCRTEQGIAPYGHKTAAIAWLRNDGNYIRHVSVWMSHLEDNANIPSSIFPIDQKQQKVIKVIDRLNDKYGDHTIRNAFLLYADRLTTVPNGYTVNRYELRVDQKV